MSLKNIFTITVLLLPACAPAYAQICRVHNQSTSESAVTISERTYPRRDIIGDPDGTKYCQVMFRARVDNQWYDAHGSAKWTSDKTIESTCGQAIAQAEQDLISSIGNTRIAQKTVLICDDDERFRQLEQFPVGTVGDLEQFRLHHDYPREFAYNGARCRWILDTVYQNSDVKTLQGIICNLNGNKWAIVDKF